MIERLPDVRPFTPAKLRWRLVDSVVEGPEGFGLPPAEQSTDGGGWWEAEFGEMSAATDAHHRALRGFAARYRGGLPVNVPFLELAPTGEMEEVGFDDDTGFDDNTLFTGGLMAAHLEASVSLRDDAALIRVTTDHPLRGSDIFSMARGEGLGDEMHQCDDVVEVSPGLWSVTITPGFRQGHAAGAALNFNDPACAMRPRDREGLWPTFVRGWIVRSSVRFVEAI